MRKAFMITSLLAVFFIGCKQDAKKEEVKENDTTQVEEIKKTDGLVALQGEFIYIADAAVLKGNDFIYGVELDSMSMKLAEEVKPLKREDFDMVPVMVKAKVKPNPAKEGWDQIIEIKEILKVSAPTGEEAIKVKGK
ncbi:hypothetical protein RBU60_01960 [Mesonia sp. MT50]|uniref:NlpE C-terminal OB domain-containing protein n=1 Tax=Mesonia profundi TaxID=3070998 RepID=A0ABU0ZXX9_9FLAO|nr:hypothetical protein [Mesonia profundi]MDQ7916325.1 hypothetical protein [Mesonia profundi]